MLSNNHNSCAFAEQIVSYIYDEATAKERENFEVHLLDCLPCADEIAGFGLIRSSIGEWRSAEVFAPALEIGASPTVEKSSWLDGLRNLFTPAWAGGFAALIVCVGLIWWFSGNSNQNIAANITPQIVPVNKNQSNELPVPPNEEKAVVIPKEKDSEIAPKPVQVVEKKIVEPKQNPVRASNNAPKSKSPKQKANESTMANLNNTNKTNKIQKTPSLSEVDGDEDNSLRLAELFDEIDSK